MKPKLVRNRKVLKLSKEKSTVKGALLRALDDSYKHGWKKVLIIGKGADSRYQMRHTREDDDMLLGMIETAKGIIIKDA